MLKKEIVAMVQAHGECYKAFNWYGDLCFGDAPQQEHIGYYTTLTAAKAACKRYGESCEWDECDLYIKRWKNGKCEGRQAFGSDTKWYLQYKYDDSFERIKEG